MTKEREIILGRVDVILRAVSSQTYNLSDYEYLEFLEILVGHLEDYVSVAHNRFEELGEVRIKQNETNSSNR